MTLLDLDDWPEMKVRRYRVILEQVSRWEEAQAELARQKAELDSKRTRR